MVPVLFELEVVTKLNNNVHLCIYSNHHDRYNARTYPAPEC